MSRLTGKALVALMMILAVLAAGPVQHASAAEPAWWDPSYAHRSGLRVTTADALVTGYSLSMTIDHAALVATSRSLSSGNDVRIVRWNGSTWTELDRVLAIGSSWNTSTTTVYFRTPQAIAANTPDVSFYLYHGKPTAGVPPANPNNVYDLFDDFENPAFDGSIDGSKWWAFGNATTQATQTGGQARITSTSIEGNSWVGFRTKQNFASNRVAESSFSVVSQSAGVGNHWETVFGARDNFELSVGHAFNGASKSIRGATVYYGSSTMSNTTLGPVRVASSMDAYGTVRYSENGALRVTRPAASTASGGLSFITVHPGAAAGGQFDYRFDDIVIRKFVANQPVVDYATNAIAKAYVAVDPTLSFTVNPFNNCNAVADTSGTTVTGSAVSFGRVNAGANAVGSMQLTAATNAATGALIYARSSGALNDGGSLTIDNTTGSNATPGAFAASGSEGFGYTTSETLFSTGTNNRFTNGGVKWAPFSTTNAEVGRMTVPGTRSVCMALQVGVSANTEARTYSTTVFYTAVPSF